MKLLQSTSYDEKILQNLAEDAQVVMEGHAKYSMGAGMTVNSIVSSVTEDT